MPNYKYKCLECGHQFQKLLPAGTEKTACLECGHHEAQKLLEAPGVHFRGQGFYLTDSKNKEDKKLDDKPSSAQKDKS